MPGHVLNIGLLDLDIKLNKHSKIANIIFYGPNFSACLNGLLDLL